MPTLNWMGKEKVVNHHRDVPFRVLERVPEKSVLDSRGSDCGNMIIHGDNLEALKSLLPEYEGKVDCIYIDPPYNTGNEGWIYNDNVNDPRITKWLGQVVGKEGEDFSRHDKWLCMMYPRLQLLRKMMSPTGLIFISIDDNEQSNLKCICDEIFGAGNFQGSIHWRRRHNQPNDKTKLLGLVAEHILCYSKSKLALKELMRNENYGKVEITGKFSNPDNDPRGDWASKPWKAATNQGGTRYRITAPDGSIFDETWLGEKSTYEALLADGRIYFPKSRSGKLGAPRKKYFKSEREDEGQCATNWWPHDIAGCNQNATDELAAIFPETDGKAFDNPKPIELISRIIGMSTHRDSIILDAFAGSGTTGAAVLKQNSTDLGSRKFLLIEIGDYADSVTAERIRRVISGYGEGKSAVAGIDSGFSYYELGPALFDVEEPPIESKSASPSISLNASVPAEEVRRYVWHTEARTPYVDRTAECPWLLGEHAQAAYYLAYVPGQETVLDYDLLKELTMKGHPTVVYASRCALSQEQLDAMGIVFKQIPSQIARM